MYRWVGYGFALLIAVDIPSWSTRSCRPTVLSLITAIAVDIQLHQICFRFADRGWYTALVIYSCAVCAFVFWTRLIYRASDMQLLHICFCFADRGWCTALVDTAASPRSAFSRGFECCWYTALPHCWWHTPVPDILRFNDRTWYTTLAICSYAK